MKKKRDLIRVFISLRMPHVGVLHRKVSGNPFGTGYYDWRCGGMIKMERGGVG